MSDPIEQAPLLITNHSDILLPGEIAAETEAADSAAPTADRSFVLVGDRWTIGRDTRRCQIGVVAQRRDISRSHATIYRGERGYVLEDHSTHGTTVNGQRISVPTTLHNEDWIGLARSPDMLQFIEPQQTIAQPALLEPDRLTERELDVLRLVAGGQSNKGIAQLRHITLNTVKGHLKSIYAKLGVKSRTEAVHLAQQRGLI